MIISNLAHLVVLEQDNGLHSLCPFESLTSRKLRGGGINRSRFFFSTLRPTRFSPKASVDPLSAMETWKGVLNRAPFSENQSSPASEKVIFSVSSFGETETVRLGAMAGGGFNGDAVVSFSSSFWHLPR